MKLPINHDLLHLLLKYAICSEDCIVYGNFMLLILILIYFSDYAIFKANFCLKDCTYFKDQQPSNHNPKSRFSEKI